MRSSPKSTKQTLRLSPIVILTFILILIGFLFISISSLTEASSTIGDKFFFSKKQLIWIVISWVVFFVTSKIPLETIKKASPILYFSSLFLLFLVLIPQLGNKTLGARRWLDIGFTEIQPSEILKLFSIIYFAKLFSQADKRTIKNLLLYLGIPFVLIIAQPNLSTAILISAIVITIYYLSGGEIIHLFTLGFFATIVSFLLVISSPYRMARLQGLSTGSYHSNQIIMALASGGIFGKGFANSDQKYRFLPKISTDSIVAVIGEETGIIGIITVILLFIFLIVNIFKIANSSKDSFESLLISGIGCWIAFQALINISAIVALIPLTGVPLPFISYGGSSLISLMSAMGLVYNIERNRPKLLYYSADDNIQKESKNHLHNRHPPHPRS
ncbi:MAG: FtsW/RodA/SpoVE family cell cycle protein [Candidatus Shapirobacteria bacterium]|jgi:cell division protein FtsW